VRLALGAPPPRIVGSFAALALRLIGIGIAVGVAVLVVARTLLTSVVFGVSPLDGVSLGGAALTLGAVACLAALVAARRAAAVDPIESIRAE